MSIYRDQRNGAVGFSNDESKRLIKAYRRSLRELEQFLKGSLSVGATDRDSLIEVANKLDVSRQVYNRLSQITKNSFVSISDVERRFSALDRSVSKFLSSQGYKTGTGAMINVMFEAIEKGMPIAWDGINAALGHYSLSVQQEIVNGIILGKSIPQIVNDALYNTGVLSSGVFSEAQTTLAIQKAVRWNVQKAVNFGAVEYYKRLNDMYGMGIKGKWVAQVATACESCLELHGTIVEMGSAFDVPHSYHAGYYGTDMLAPPLHVNCKCIIVPYFDYLEGRGTFDSAAMREEDFSLEDEI